MRVKVNSGVVEALGERLLADGYDGQSKAFARQYVSGRNEDLIVNIKGSVDAEFAAYLRNVAKEMGLRGLQGQCTQVYNILSDVDSGTIKSLRAFETALRTYLEKDAIDGWLYRSDRDGNFSAYLVTSVYYQEADPSRERPESVTIKLLANDPRSDSGVRTDSVTFTRDSVSKRTMAEALSEQRLFKENTEYKLEYVDATDSYRDLRPRFGQQLTSMGTGLASARNSWSHYDIDFGRSGVPSKLVNDESEKKRTYSLAMDGEFWRNADDNECMFDMIPLHPYILMFDLSEHRQVYVHASALDVYVYDPSLREKLILPDEHRDLIDILCDDMDVVMDDIVAGKSGGSTILCIGSAGLGKTLSAEVYSEVVERPLYRVHSGQLGTTPEKVEENLKDILDRSSRWGSVLLLDEADVYIRERDNSMDHNAVVAAFLRTLEYFSGLLFMTTNRAGDVDDAIKSRCIAIIKYETPSAVDAKKIWATLSTQFGIEMSQELIDGLVEAYPGASGRDIKELLKLASKYSRQRKVDIDLDLFRKCSMFRGVDMAHKKQQTG